MKYKSDEDMPEAPNFHESEFRFEAEYRIRRAIMADCGEALELCTTTIPDHYELMERLGELILDSDTFMDHLIDRWLAKADNVEEIQEELERLEDCRE